MYLTEKKIRDRYLNSEVSAQNEIYLSSDLPWKLIETNMSSFLRCAWYGKINESHLFLIYTCTVFFLLGYKQTYSLLTATLDSVQKLRNQLVTVCCACLNLVTPASSNSKLDLEFAAIGRPTNFQWSFYFLSSDVWGSISQVNFYFEAFVWVIFKALRVLTIHLCTFR
jgi:hypothetical protein